MLLLIHQESASQASIPSQEEGEMGVYYKSVTGCSYFCVVSVNTRYHIGESNQTSPRYALTFSEEQPQGLVGTST